MSDNSTYRSGGTPPPVERDKEEPCTVSLVRGPIVFEKGSVNNEATPAIGFAYIAGYLRQFGYDVEIIDGIGEGLNKIHPLNKYPGFMIHGLELGDVIERIPATSRVIGFSAMFSGEWPVLRDLIQEVRQRFPDALLVAGGEHASALPKFCLQDCAALDVVVCGEGEHAFLELLENQKAGGSYDAVSGLCFLDQEGQLVETGQQPRIRDLKLIPWPYWPKGYLEKFWAAGKSHGVLTERDMPMLASRGCPYQCTFCSNPSMWTTRYVLREVDDVLDEIEHYVKEYSITSVQFYDLTAITKRRWIVEFCNKLIEKDLDIEWSLPAGTRSEVLDNEVLGLAKRSGCHYLVYAPESGSVDTLKVIKKRITIGNIVDSMRAAKKNDLVLRANMIIGFPQEARLQIYKTLWFGLRLSWLGVDEIPLFIFSPYPGTEISRKLEVEGAIVLGDEYFLGLTSLNGKYSGIKPRTYNKYVSGSELAVYRLTFMVLYYIVGYLRFPRRILRTIRNILFFDAAATVFEHRLRDFVGRLIRSPQR